ncbi:FtsX-like permease family protein [Treponema sp.]
MIVLTIAFRNLLEHKAKTAIVGFLIAIAITVLVVGNSFMDSIKTGMRKSYAENYSGDLIIHAQSEDTFSLIPIGPGSVDTPVLPDYQALRQAAQEAPSVQAILPMISGLATLNVDEAAAGAAVLWGVNFSEYQRMFPSSLQIIEGSFPADGQPFVLLTEKVRADAEEELGKKINVGDKITLGGFGGDGLRLREVSIAGFYSFERSGAQLERVCLVDVGTLRSLKGMTAIASVTQQVLSNTETISEDELFSDELFSSGILETSESPSAAAKLNYETLLGDLSIRDTYLELDNDAWNFILVRLTDSTAYPAAAASINAVIAESGIKAEVSDWTWGAGFIASIAFSIQIFFNVIVLIISVVAIIIIMNTLVISVTERIPEIGTIRAIGGSKRFVRSMIVWETLTISAVFGLAGILLGTLILALANKTGIPASNMFLELLFGGSTFHPELSPLALILSILATAGIGTLASLYPTSVALKISPLKAMQKG